VVVDDEHSHALRFAGAGGGVGRLDGPGSSGHAHAHERTLPGLRADLDAAAGVFEQTGEAAQPDVTLAAPLGELIGIEPAPVVLDRSAGPVTDPAWSPRPLVTIGPWC
jgi:hypothetical protein